jgi:polyisoprenyl-phosphate glycosyltransferase
MTKEENALSLSFIVPAYDEEKGIEKLLQDLTTTLSQVDISTEIIVVNDGSTDSTRLLLESQSNPAFRVINHPINIGYGASLKTGIKAARYSWIGIIDGDGSYDCASIPMLVSFAIQGFDMVIAARENISELDSPIKHFFRCSLRNFLSILVDRDILDANSGLRIFRKSAVEEFIPYLCNTFSFTTSLTVFFAESGRFLKYVPTNYRQRRGQSKVRHLRDTLRTLQMVFQGVAYFNPLKAFLLLTIGLVTLVCIPAMVLALFELQTLALYSMIFGATSFSLVGMGLLADAIRMSQHRRDR